MIIKKFKAKTETEAVEQARKELGEGVVILSSRSAKKKGLFAMFSPAMVEITAALEDDGNQNPLAPKPEEKKTGDQKPSSKPKSGGLLPDELIAQSIPEALRDKDPLVAKGSFPPKDTGLSPAKEPPKASDPQSPAGGTEPVPGPASMGAATFTGGTPPYTDTARGRAAYAPASQPLVAFNQAGLPAQPPLVSGRIPFGDGIEQRLDSLQSLIEQQILPRTGVQIPEANGAASSGEGSGGGENRSFIKLLYDTMIDNEVSPENADIIIREIEGSTKQGQSIDHLLANVYQKMILKFGKSVGIRPAEKGVKVLFFVGPTGVGKTTTIAKIASRFSVEEKKKVALLTADTYRIAAAEQLATYANILDVPFRIVYTPSDMTGFLTEYMGYDYVLVDTPGHSHYNDVQKESMNQFIHSVDGVAPREVFLVLSATTKYRDLLHIADAYRDMTDYKLIFTKLDETATLGNLLNLKLYTGSEISYVTCGQNVPDDIENFNPQKTVKQLLGGKR